MVDGGQCAAAGNGTATLNVEFARGRDGDRSVDGCRTYVVRGEAEERPCGCLDVWIFVLVLVLSIEDCVCTVTVRCAVWGVQCAVCS